MKNNNFIKISDSLIKHEVITSEEKFIYAVIRANNPTGSATVSVVNLLKQMGMNHSDSRNKSKMRGFVTNLEAHQFIEVYEDQAEMCRVEASKMKPSTLYFIKMVEPNKGGYFTMFDVEIVKKFMTLKKKEKFGVFSVYASIVSPIFESESSCKVSWISQETIQIETGLSGKTVSKYIYILKDELKVVDFRKMRFTAKKQIKGKNISKTHNFYWRVGDSAKSIFIYIKDAMDKLGYSNETHYIQVLDRDNNPINEVE
ncbi:TPA: hypothetical protein ACGXNJ_005100 [Bacillus cereus]